MKCCMPNCDKEISKDREKQGFISCSKKCVNAWSWLPKSQREKIRGKQYGVKK